MLIDATCNKKVLILQDQKIIGFVHVDRTGGYRLCIFWECDVYLENNYLKTSVILNCVTNGI